MTAAAWPLGRRGRPPAATRTAWSHASAPKSASRADDRPATRNGRGGNRTLKARQGPAVFETVYRAHGSPSSQMLLGRWRPSSGIFGGSGIRSRGFMPLRASKTAAPLRPSPGLGRSTQRAVASKTSRHCIPCPRAAHAERCCLCHSPTLRPWIIRRRVRMSRSPSVLRGGALEPESRNWTIELHAKANAI
jgi:hypothetical protein